MSRIENPREAIKDGSTGIFCLSITCQYGLLTKQFFTARLTIKINGNEVELEFGYCQRGFYYAL